MNFEDQIRRIFSKYPEHPINYRMFQNIYSELYSDKQEKASRVPSWLVFISGMMLSGLFLTLFFFQNPPKETLLNQPIIVINDTIYIQKNREPNLIKKNIQSKKFLQPKIVSDFDKSSFFSSGMKMTYLQHNYFSKAKTNGKSLINPFGNILYKARNSNTSSKKQKIDTNENNLIDRVELSEIANLSLLNLDFLQHSRKEKRIVRNTIFNHLLLTQKNKKMVWLSSILHFFKPKYFQLYSRIGTFSSLNKITQKSSSIVDFNMEMGLNKYISLQTGITWLSTGYERFYKGVDILSIKRFPVLLDIPNGHKLDRIVSEIKYIYIPIGIKYNINSRYPLKPYIGTGILSQITTKSDLEYYLDGDYSYERKTELPTTKYSIFSDYYVFLGLTYKYNSNIGINIETAYQKNFITNKFKYQDNKLVSYKLGLQYTF